MAKRKKKKENMTKDQKAQRSKDKRFLEILILRSKNAITGQGTGIDELFKEQAKRLQIELSKLK